MLEFGRTWRERVQRRLMKARARCWETCFLRLVSMTSRHWSTISTPSLVAPRRAEIPFRAVLVIFSLCNFTDLQKNRRWISYLSQTISLTKEVMLYGQEMQWVVCHLPSIPKRSPSHEVTYRWAALAGHRLHTNSYFSVIIIPITTFLKDKYWLKTHYLNLHTCM